MSQDDTQTVPGGSGQAEGFVKTVTMFEGWYCFPLARVKRDTGKRTCLRKNLGQRWVSISWWAGKVTSWGLASDNTNVNGIFVYFNFQ